MSPRAVLVGAPGAGKSTIGRQVALKLGCAFRDTDADIAAAAGKPVSSIFVEDGEPVFRAMEIDAVARALASFDGVLALGGGAVLAEQTRAALAGHRVIYLEVGLPMAARRVGLNRDRPLLLENPRATLKKLLDARRPLYSEVATATIPADGRVNEVVAQVLAALESTEVGS
ncbi:MAG TPA: shikimate kinase [Sporichthyaceae bacterium]|nr:shikimate kinase [Sporichthyaceae bacterium]